jgi:cyclomaltodextrinase / maltogenic alpha-amylase / neopullulanase
MRRNDHPGDMVTRRELLRRTGAIGAAGLVSGHLPEKGVAHMRQGDATPHAVPPISLDLLGGDVWAWTKLISGTCPGIPDDATISLTVNDTDVAVERTGETFSAEVSLQPGPNTLVAMAQLVSGDEERSEPVIHTVRLSPRPTARIAARVDGGALTLDGTTSTPSDYDDSPLVSYQWTNRQTNPVALSLTTGQGGDASPVVVESPVASAMVADMPGADGEYYVSLNVTDEAGRSDVSTVCILVEDGVARAMDPVVEETAWIGEAVVYGMVVRNFTSDGFQGVASRLGELEELGITAIWFAPITRTPEGDFGYAVTDYFDVRPEYGTLDEFRTLVDASHAHGIRVLMDFVPNHTSIEHSYYQHAESFGDASPYYDFYDRDSGGTVTHYFSWDHLPNLNFDNPEVRRFMTEAFSSWVRDYDVDGFRVDVAWGVKERRPDYWLDLSAELNRIKPDVLLIAEASARDPYYVQNGFDAAYDWTDELGVWAWGEVFANGFPLSKAMPEALTADGEGYDPDSLILRFLNNNDTGQRFISIYGVNRYRAALVLLMTLPGIPCLYTGDETGAQFQPYETVDEIDWSDPNDFRSYVTRLVQLRNQQPAFHSRDWSQIEVEPAVEMFGYLRPADDDASIAVILNYSTNDINATVALPPELAGVALTDLWTGEQFPPANGDMLTVSVPAWGFRAVQANRAAAYGGEQVQ